MPVTLTIKQVPDPIAAGLKRRADANRRSLQKELLHIIEDATEFHVAEPPAPAYLPTPAARGRARKDARLSLDELWQRARKLGPASPSESTDIVRRDRDARHGR